MRFDEDSGQLDLRPVSPAYATQLRLLGRQMIARINTKTGREAVKSIRVLPPGPDQGAQAGGAPGSASPTSLEAAEAAPVRTRETASMRLPRGSRYGPGGQARKSGQPGHPGGDRAAKPGAAPQA